jgi:hypothetical protein
MRAIRAISCLALVAAVSTLAAGPVLADDRPAAQTREIQPRSTSSSTVTTKTVRVADVTSATPYVTFTVPDCVVEIAYVMDGAEGGSSRRVGTNPYAAGGQGAVRSGTISVTPGEELRLYPAAKGGAAQLDSDIGDAGAGGAIGYRKGGGGTGMDQGAGLWNVRQNAGGGGGAGAAITAGTSPLVVAGGGGGAGGSSWNDAKNTAVGGAGDVRGGDGVSNAGSGGTLGAGASGAGVRGSDPTGNGGGSGGGGGGYLGGGAGRASTSGSQGGGGGAGGTSYTDASRAGTGSVDDYGLAASDVTPTGDGIVTIAWNGCAAALTLQGTETDAAGATSPAAGWNHTVTVTGGTSVADSPALDADGSSHLSVHGFENAADTRTVTVTQEARPGWVLRDWDDTGMHRPLATCAVLGDGGTDVTVTNVDAHSFRIDIAVGQWIVCSFDTVEGAPDMSVSASATDVASGLPAGPAVTSGDAVDFAYTVRNTGNLPLDLTISDPRNDALACVKAALLPGDQTLCSGTLSVTRD